MTNIEYVELGEVCEVVRGGSPRPIIDYITEDEDGVNWLKIGDVSETDKYFSHANEKIKPSGISKSRPVVAGDLILSNSMSFGRAFITLIDGYIHDGWLRLRCDESRIDKEYLYYFLTSDIAQNQFKAVATGSVVNNLKADTVKAAKIALPSLRTQKRIANVLSMLDKKIENNRAINRNLSEQARTIYRDWFVDYGHFDGMVPDNWCDGEMGDLAEIKTATFKPVKEPNAIVEHYSIPALDEKHFPVFEQAEGIKSNKYLLTKQSVMISKLNPNTKRIWRPLCLSEKPVCSTEFIVFEALIPKNKDYVYSILDSAAFSNHLCSNVTGSTGSRQRAIPKATLGFEVKIPPQKIIDEFCSIVTPIYDLISKNEIENQRLAEMRDKLLPKLMSGELDVSELEG